MIRTAEFLGVEPASLLPRRVDGAPAVGGGGGAGAVPRTGFEPAAFCSKETLDGIIAPQGRQLSLLPAMPPLPALTATPATAPAAGIDATRHQMSRAEAAWVREHAWTPAMRKEHTITPAASSTCPCQRGPCGQCSAGHHNQCPYTDPDQTTWAARRANVAATHVTDTHHQVPALNGPDTWRVWEAGIIHDARCPCALAGHPDRTPPPTQTTINDFL